MNATAASSIAAIAIAGSSQTQSSAAENANAQIPASAATSDEPGLRRRAVASHERG